ncbi:MAG TPA: hypothetical protein PK068_02540 [Nitrosomonas sp.]|nr:hypothetical protein [Nitrosomonas sp.]
MVSLNHYHGDDEGDMKKLKGISEHPNFVTTHCYSQKNVSSRINPMLRPHFLLMPCFV